MLALDPVDIAERLRRSLELFIFAWDDRCFAVTASIGVACIADGNTTLEDAMRRADAACYRAKEKGRNRVQVDNGRPDVVVVAARPREAVAARGHRRRRPLNPGIRLQTSSNGVAAARLCDAAATLLPKKLRLSLSATPPCALIHDGQNLPR